MNPTDDDATDKTADAGPRLTRAEVAAAIADERLYLTRGYAATLELRCHELAVTVRTLETQLAAARADLAAHPSATDVMEDTTPDDPAPDTVGA